MKKMGFRGFLFSTTRNPGFKNLPRIGNNISEYIYLGKTYFPVFNCGSLCSDSVPFVVLMSGVHLAHEPIGAK